MYRKWTTVPQQKEPRATAPPTVPWRHLIVKWSDVLNDQLYHGVTKQWKGAAAHSPIRRQTVAHCYNICYLSHWMDNLPVRHWRVTVIRKSSSEEGESLFPHLWWDLGDPLTSIRRFQWFKLILICSICSGFCYSIRYNHECART